MSGSSHSLARPAAFLLAALALSAAAGLAFAGWLEHAPAILVTLAEQGLAWCF